MAARLQENIYECEVKRRRLADGGGYEYFWKIKSVAEALADADSDYRCKECHGAVKLFRSHVIGGPAPHAEHKSRVDSEYCLLGIYFRQAKDGRSQKLSNNPVK